MWEIVLKTVPTVEYELDLSFLEIYLGAGALSQYHKSVTHALQVCEKLPEIW